MTNKLSLEIVNFKRELDRVEREVKQQANLEIGERVQFATETLKIVTPVDTGEARLGWENNTFIALDGYLDGAINNDVEHIVYLNRGSSKQAPSYFIEQVLTKIGVIRT